MIDNIGRTDRIIRLVGGVLILAMAYFSGAGLFDGTLLMNAVLVTSVVTIGTAITGFCPFYRVLGIRT